MNRLAPNEYLNDTLVEYGMKFVHTFRVSARLLSIADELPPNRRVLDRLKETQPDLADQVHVFSSFFYKKLSTKDKYVQSRFYRSRSRTN